MAKRCRWFCKASILILLSYCLYLVSIYDETNREANLSSEIIIEGPKLVNNGLNTSLNDNHILHHSGLKEKVYRRLQFTTTSEDKLPPLELQHKLEIERIFAKIQNISAPIIHLKQYKNEPFSASFEKVEVTCRRYNLTGLFKHFGFAVDQMLDRSFTEQKQCEPVENVLWVTVSNMDLFCHVHLATPLRILGYKFLNLNYDFTTSKNALPPGFRKLYSLVENYRIWKEYEYVVFADTSDVILTKCPSEALRKTIAWMKRTKVDILFNAAPYVWPSNKHDKKWYYDTYNCSTANETDPDHCFLDSGVWIAKSAHLLFYFQETLSYHRNVSRQSKDILSKNSDQALYTALHQNYYPKVQVDVKSHLSRRFYLSNDKKHGQFGLGVNPCYLLPDPMVYSKCDTNI